MQKIMRLFLAGSNLTRGSSLPQRLKPALKNAALIAAVNRCATRKQVQNR